MSGLIASNPNPSTTFGRGSGDAPLSRPLLLRAESPSSPDLADAEFDEQLSNHIGVSLTLQNLA